MNSTNSKKLFIIAGEPSGDLAASNLISAVRSQSADAQFAGMGGELMERAGAKLFHKIGKLSVIGFAEVVKKLPRYKKLLKHLLNKLASEMPDAVILVDFPGFNIRFAKSAKKLNIPVIYYISPQVWAWAKGRIKTIKSVVDRMLVLFEFEKNLYQQHGIDSVSVGHPLVDSVKPAMSKEQAFKTFGLNPALKTIALLPGSRHSEIKKVLPVMLKTARLLSSEICHSEGAKRPKNLKREILRPFGAQDDSLSSIQFILIKSPIIDNGFYEKIISRNPLSVKIADRDRYDAMNCADLCIVASGTATLETAILNKPMVIVYKVAFLTWLIARALIRIPYIGMVNVIAGEKIVPEFIQFGARPSKIAKTCVGLLNSPEKIRLVKSQLAVVKEKLGPPGASQRAAEEIIRFLNSRHRDAG